MMHFLFISIFSSYCSIFVKIFTVISFGYPAKCNSLGMEFRTNSPCGATPSRADRAAAADRARHADLDVYGVCAPRMADLVIAARVDEAWMRFA